MVDTIKAMPHGWFEPVRPQPLSYSTLCHSSICGSGSVSSGSCSITLSIPEAKLRELLPPGADDNASVQPTCPGVDVVSDDDLRATVLHVQRAVEKYRMAQPVKAAAANMPANAIVKDIISEPVFSHGFVFCLRFAVHWPQALAFVGVDAAAPLLGTGTTLPLPSNLGASVSIEASCTPPGGVCVCVPCMWAVLRCLYMRTSHIQACWCLTVCNVCCWLHEAGLISKARIFQEGIACCHQVTGSMCGSCMHGRYCAAGHAWWAMCR